MRVAVLDLGTNTFHLLIADISEKRIDLLHKEKIFVKIGEGGISEGRISEAAQQRALKALVRYREKATELEATHSFATATSAIRNAANGRQLLQKINEQTGFYPQSISGAQEAEWIYKGVVSEIPIAPAETALIMDIGGGSVEFILANSESVLWKESFEIGAQRLYDAFFNSDPISQTDLDRLETYTEEKLQPLWSACFSFRPSYLIGSAGTFDTLRDMELAKGNQSLAESYQLSVASYEQLHRLLLVSNRAGRMKIRGMIEERVDMIVVASALLNYVIKKLKLPFIQVSDASLKEGVLQEIKAGNIELTPLTQKEP